MPRSCIAPVLRPLSFSCATVATIGGHHHFARGIVDAACQCLRRESRKYHRVNRTYTRTRQHRNRQIGNHRHVEAHAVAFGYALAFQHVGKLAHSLVQLCIADVLRGFVWMVRLENNRRLLRPRCQMAVNAVLGNVQLRTVKPLHLWRVEIPI